MKKIFLLIGIIIALAIIVHAETKGRQDTGKSQTVQNVTSSYETLSMMRDIIDLQERIVKGGEPKKVMLRDLAQLRIKTDKLLSEISRNASSRSMAQTNTPPSETVTP
jgi:hypothetical protein